MGGYCSTAFSRKFEGGSRVHDLHHAKYHRTREELDLNRILYYYKVVLEGRNYSAQSNSLNKEPVDLQEELLMFLFSLSEVARLPSLGSLAPDARPLVLFPSSRDLRSEHQTLPRASNPGVLRRTADRWMITRCHTRQMEKSTLARIASPFSQINFSPYPGEDANIRLSRCGVFPLSS